MKNFLKKIKFILLKNFCAFNHKNFRIFWSGQSISVIGTWMQTISLPWLSYTLTNSPFLVGVVGAVQFLPTLLLTLFAGVLNDKFKKKEILIITQSTLAFSAFILALLIFTNTIKYYLIIIIALIIGTATAFDMPTRQAFVIELVGKNDLMNAIALNSAVFNMARIIGPALGGLTIAYIGIEYCFLFNAISFLPVIIGLFFIVPYEVNNNKNNLTLLESIKDGIKYCYQKKSLFWVLMAVFVLATFAMNFNVLVPVFTKTILNKGEKDFGFLMSCMGIGSFLGALNVATKSKKGPKRIFLLLTSISTSILFILIGINKNFLFTGILLGFTGFCNTSFFTTANSFLQLNSEDEYRGRVVSLYALLFNGTTPIGNLFCGSISNHFGANYAFIICGILIFTLILLMFTIIVFLNKKTFRI